MKCAVPVNVSRCQNVLNSITMLDPFSEFAAALLRRLSEDARDAARKE
jgi:hypothetical protein